MHLVAHAAHVLDEFGAELLAQGVNVHLNRVAFDLLVPAVELLFQRRARDHLARAVHQRREQRELALELLRLGAGGDPAGFEHLANGLQFIVADGRSGKR